MTFEGITGYDGELKTRLSTKNDGDVLGIPNSVQPDQFADFFEPLGDTEELADDDRFLTPKSFDGTQYGLALGGNANGIVHNTAVLEEVGITELPANEDEWLAAMDKIQQNTDAPRYTHPCP